MVKRKGETLQPTCFAVVLEGSKTTSQGLNSRMPTEERYFIP